VLTPVPSPARRISALGNVRKCRDGRSFLTRLWSASIRTDPACRCRCGTRDRVFGYLPRSDVGTLDARYGPPQLVSGHRPFKGR